MKTIHFLFTFICIGFGKSIYTQTNYPGPQVPYKSCTNCLQNNYQYSGTIDYFSTRNVISDFGPRYLANNAPYDFHGGIDYTITEPIGSPPNDIGYHIVAIDAGTIIKLENYNGGNLKYLVIDGPGNNDYGYLHLFDDTGLPTQIGDMKYVEIEDGLPNQLTYGILNLTPNSCIRNVKIWWQQLNFIENLL